jgi:hypothetical protein
VGATMRQECNRIAGAYEAREREIEALQIAFLECVRQLAGCYTPCPAYRAHPAPWHAENCKCAESAREDVRDHLRSIEAKAFPETTD